MHQEPEDQFLHCRQKMEREHEEDPRQMQQLQDRIESLQRENDQLSSPVEKNLELGKDVREGDCVKPQIVLNKGKEPVIFGDDDSSTEDECPPEGPHPRVLYQEGTPEVAQGPNREGNIHTALPLVTPSVALPVGLESRLTGGKTNRFNPLETLMPPMHPAFGAWPIFYVKPTTLILGPDNILNYEPPRGFFMPAFTMCDGSNDPYDHMLHYN